MFCANLMLDHFRLDTIRIPYLLSITCGHLQGRPGPGSVKTLGEEGKSCDTNCQPARPENGIRAHSIQNHFGYAFLEFGQVRAKERNGMDDSVDVVLLGVMPERAVAHFQQLCRACSHTVTGFDGRNNVSAFQILNVLLQVESAFG